MLASASAFAQPLRQQPARPRARSTARHPFSLDMASRRAAGVKVDAPHPHGEGEGGDSRLVLRRALQKALDDRRRLEQGRRRRDQRQEAEVDAAGGGERSRPLRRLRPQDEGSFRRSGLVLSAKSAGSMAEAPAGIWAQCL